MTMIYTEAGVLHTPLSMSDLQAFLDRPVPWSFCQTAPDEQGGSHKDPLWVSGVDWEENDNAVRAVLSEHVCPEECGCWLPEARGPFQLDSGIEAKMLELIGDRFRSMTDTYAPAVDPEHVVMEWADDRTTHALSGMLSIYRTPEQRVEDNRRLRELLAARKAVQS